eukprot:Phypoly_transcript_01319.p1 GENE.Phypoly_transcript_01319~~Phypoly_transcript_01319.p1  ORF type:complete len:993 (+),score=250.77 Phypoly_transcript_01319:209-3187(+)
MVDHHHHNKIRESMGELQVTIIAGKNLRSDGKSESAYCTVDLPGNKTARTNASKSREPVWNESFNFDLMRLDNDEVLIQVFGKRRISTDKFLGQLQVPIKGLNLSKDITWHYLTDKPKNGNELPDHLRSDPTRTSDRAKSPTHRDDKKKGKEEKEDKTYITGEISVRLNFTHRFLLRGKSKAELLTNLSPLSNSSGSEMNSPPATPSSSRPQSPSFPSSPDTNGIKGSGGLELPTSARGPERHSPVPKLELARPDTSSPPTSPRREPEKQVSFPSVPKITPRDRAAGSSANVEEAKAIETAFKEKLALVKQKLKEKRELISLLTTNVNLLKHQPDQEQFNIEMHKLNEMQRELTELEKLEKEFTESLDSTARRAPITATQSIRNMDRTRSRAQLRERRNTRNFENGTLENRRSSKRLEGLDPDTFSDETKYLRYRVNSIETELLHERKMSDLVNSKNALLEKETKRLEEELQKLQFTNEIREKELAKVKAECDRLNREVRKLNGGQEGGEDGMEFTRSPTPMFTPNYTLDLATSKFLDSAFRDGTDLAFEAIKKICGEVKSISKESKDELEAQRREIEEQLRGVELGIERHMMMQKRVEVDAMSRKLVKKQELLNQLDQKQRKKDGNSEGGDSEGDEEDDESDEESERMFAPGGSSDAKLDMLVVKLEKLDKLDELLKKIDNMKYAAVSYASDSQGEQARNYEDIKKELEEFQKIIVDETGKFTEREKEEANIKYEKVFTELSQTKQYKAEVAQQLEEKRRANEPLNKASLEKLLKVYNAENLQKDPSLRDKVLKNPELSLIGLDPKAILAKHQNDFGQYLLRLTEIDELRAIRASLPKFRPDQKRQIEWVEILEAKIETVAKAPPKKPAPPKPPSAKSWKPKPPTKKDAPPTDMFAELLAKRKKFGGDDADDTPAINVVSPRPSSSLSSSSSSSVDLPLSDDSSTTPAPGSVRGKLKLAPTKQPAHSLGRTSGISHTPPAAPPPPPPPISF